MISDPVPSVTPASELNRLMRKKLDWGRDCEDTAAMVSNRIGSKLQWRQKRLVRGVSCNS